MSPFDQLKAPLDHVLDCARRLVDLSFALLNGQEHFDDDVRRLRRDLPHLIQKALAAFRGDERGAADLKHELSCVQEDTSAMVQWVECTTAELRRLFAASGTDGEAAMRYGQASAKSFRDIERYRHAVVESCNRAFTEAIRICAAAEEEEKKRSASPNTPKGNPPADVTGTGAGNEPKGATAEPNAADPKLPPSRHRAYAQYLDAIRRNTALTDASDQDVYAWLQDYLDEGEKLPTFATWSKYVREARKATGTNKNHVRAGRDTGKSIVRPDQI
jgi:hypothetical protein